MTYTDILYEKKRRCRVDHHQPAGGAERLSHADRRRADRRLRRRAVGSLGRRGRAHGRRRPRLLLGRRPEGAGPGRLRHRPAPHGRRGAAQRDPPHPEARHRHGQRLRHRRRSRAARALRPLASPPTPRSSARRGRAWAASTPGTAPATSRASSARRRRARSGTCAGSTRPTTRSRWGSSTRWCRSRICAPRWRSGARSCSRRARPRWRSPSSRSTSTPSSGRASPSSPHRARPLLPDAGGDGGPQRVRREAPGQLLEVQEVMETTLTPERISRVHRAAASGATRASRPTSTGGRPGAGQDRRRRRARRATRTRSWRARWSASPTGSAPTASSRAASSPASSRTGTSSSCSSWPPRRLGAVVNPIPPTYRASELRFMLGLLESQVRRHPRDLPRLPTTREMLARIRHEPAEARARLRGPRGAGRGHAAVDRAHRHRVGGAGGPPAAARQRSQPRPRGGVHVRHDGRAQGRDAHPQHDALDHLLGDRAARLLRARRASSWPRRSATRPGYLYGYCLNLPARRHRGVARRVERRRRRRG